MVTKRKNRKKSRPAVDRFQQAQRHLARRDFKQALKDAKVCHRQQPTDETHRFLQRACLARARELYRLGLRSECRAVAEHLLDIGVTEPEVDRELPELLVALGLFDWDTAAPGLPAEANSPLLLAAADHAVLRPRETPSSLSGFRKKASSIRAALDALEAGDESKAVAEVKGIARGSPFADWKYFVRGLAAYYREDTARMRANWDRLAPDRLAVRIAAPLAALANSALTDQADQYHAGATGKLETALLGEPILTGLDELKANIAAGRWERVLRDLRGLRKSFRRFDPELPRRVAWVVCCEFARRGLTAELDTLASLVDPPPMDPCWNRARALAWERAEHREIEEAESYWLAYLKDLAGLSCLSPTQRNLARALVWRRIGGLYVEECEAVPGLFGQTDCVAELQARAAECFANSIKLAPDLLSAHQSLARAQMGWKQPEKAAETYRRLLDHFPENLDSLLFLARYHLSRDEPFQAQDYVVRARQLKPLDKAIREMAWTVHIASARHWALKKEWEKGRAEFEAAEKIDSEHQGEYHVLARRAIFELKASNLGLGQRLIDQALSKTDEPAPVLLVLAIESVRYGMLKQFTADFEQWWTKSLKKRRLSSTAGRMCKTLTTHMMTSVDYPGQSTHVEQLMAYVRRCSRVKWQVDDLRDVCGFLEAVFVQKESDDVGKLLEKYARKGRKVFPQCASFAYIIGELEMKKGPEECNRRHAHECFQQALELAENSGDSKDAVIVECAKRRLTLLGELGLDDHAGFAGPPQGFFDDDDDDEPFFDTDDNYDEPFFDGSPGKLFDTFVKMCVSLGIDPSEIMDEAADNMPPGGRRRKRGPKTKRKKKKR